MKQILPGIYLEENLQIANFYFVELPLEGSFVVIDNGASIERFRLKRAIRYLKKKYNNSFKLIALLLTHSHQDHAGNTAYLAQKESIPVICHDQEAPYLMGTKKLKKRDYRGSPLFCRTVIRFGDWLLGHPLYKNPQHFNKAPLSVAENFDFIHMPGHTPGSGAWLDKRTKSLFLGDCLLNANAVTFRSKPGLFYPFSFFCEDQTLAIKSLDRLKSVEFKHAFFGHGPAICGNAKKLIVDFMESSKSID